MTSPQQNEILDLRHFSARQLRPLLEEEAGVWLTRLRWDYRSSTDLLLQYLDSRILPGFVTLTRARICGYTFFVYEGAKAVVGDLYVSRDTAAPLVVAHGLAGSLLGVLENSPDVDRIEAQLLLHDAGVLPALFPGFVTFPRLFLERDLRPGAESLARLPGASIPSDLELGPWTPSCYEASAALINAAYLGHVDSNINDQYRSLQGSLRFLHNVVRFPGCGVFDAEASWVLRDRTTRSLAAILLCSRVTPGREGPVAHITQLCVAPGFRGRGLGRLLLSACTARLPERGYRFITLTVSEANGPALDLYVSTGFTVRQRFDALVRDKINARLSLLEGNQLLQRRTC